MPQPYEDTRVNHQGELRERLVRHLEETRVLTSPAVAAAMRTVPRHIFVPGERLAEAYEDRAIAIKERDGAVISSISQPSMIVQMLQLLDVRAGMRVLEIGTGSGYNAALLAAVCAPGSVVTVDIEADLIERARTALDVIDASNVC